MDRPFPCFDVRRWSMLLCGTVHGDHECGFGTPMSAPEREKITALPQSRRVQDRRTAYETILQCEFIGHLAIVARVVV